MESSGPESPDFSASFRAYFDRNLAQEAARPLSNGIEIELRIRQANGTEVQNLVFTKQAGKNCVIPGPAKDPQVIFTMTPTAAKTILEDPAQEIGSIGVGIAKLVVSSNRETKVSVSLRTGFMNLFSKGYFGVIAAGGTRFAGYLASRGLSGMASLKEAIQKMRNQS